MSWFNRNAVTGSGSLLCVVTAAWLFIATQASGQNTNLAPPSPTLWSFLGIPQGVHRVQDSLVNRCGFLPGLERKPALRRLADPALAEIDNAAIKKAQQIKAEEDLAPQKIKAIKYLATLGCEKCYGGIEEAMLESLKDCTESVRYETVKALGTIPDTKCPHCDNDCCSEKITEQLAKMAHERDADHPDCWYEPSARIRKAAQETMRVCCCDQEAPPDAMSPGTPSDSPSPPVEGAPTAPPVEGGRTAQAHAVRVTPASLVVENVPVESVVEPAEESSEVLRLPLQAVATTNESGYDDAMEVHIAPRRSRMEGAAPEPDAEQSVVVTSFTEERHRENNRARDAENEPSSRLATVREADYAEVAPLRRASKSASTGTNRSTSRPANTAASSAVRSNMSPAPTNAYGRRYVTWGSPVGDYAPPRPTQTRPSAR